MCILIAGGGCGEEEWRLDEREMGIGSGEWGLSEVESVV